MKKTFQNYSDKLSVAFFVLALFLFQHSVYAQQVNPISQIQVAFEEGKISADEAVIQQIDLIKNHDHSRDTPVKCAVPLFLMVANNEHLLSEETKTRFNKAFRTPTVAASESFVSASGKFIVNYETTGNDAVPSGDANNNSVPDYVEWIAEAADSSHEHILGLGFTDIFNEKTAPYPIQVADADVYGFVPSGATYIGIENDFVGFPENDDPEGDQKGAVKVTIAHELKHVFFFF